MAQVADILGKSSLTVTSVPLGGYADVFSTGDAYKVVGTIINRANYPEFSLAFPRIGAVNAFNASMPNSMPWIATTFGAGVFVAVGGSNQGQGGISADGVAWDPIALPAQLSYRVVAFGAGLFVAMGADAGAATTSFVWSPDGVNWTPGALPVAAIVSGLVWSKELSLFIASCGWNPNSNVPHAFVLTSPDGVTWKTVAVPSKLWTSVVSGPSGVVVMCDDATDAGPGICVVTTDGVKFTQKTMASGHWTSVVFGKGLYVAVGYKKVSTTTTPLIATSPDLENWTLRAPALASNVSATYAACAYGDGSFLAVWNGLTLVSYSGTGWIKKVSLIAQSPPNQIGYGNGVYAVGCTATLATIVGAVVENLADSNYMYISGTTGKYVRVR